MWAGVGLVNHNTPVKNLVVSATDLKWEHAHSMGLPGAWSCESQYLRSSESFNLGRWKSLSPYCNDLPVSHRLDFRRVLDSEKTYLRRFISIYAKFILGSWRNRSAGGDCWHLLVGSSALGTVKHLPPAYGSPLCLLAMSILYGIIFMPLITSNYESYLNGVASYARWQYIRNRVVLDIRLSTVQFALDHPGWLDLRWTGFGHKTIASKAPMTTLLDVLRFWPSCTSSRSSPRADRGFRQSNRTAVLVQTGLLQPFYGVVFLDALYVKMRHEGRVENRAVYVALGINLEGKKDVLGLWSSAADANFWHGASGIAQSGGTGQ